jgi:hypothetical protein
MSQSIKQYLEANCKGWVAKKASKHPTYEVLQKYLNKSRLSLAVLDQQITPDLIKKLKRFGVKQIDNKASIEEQMYAALAEEPYDIVKIKSLLSQIVYEYKELESQTAAKKQSLLMFRTAAAVAERILESKAELDRILTPKKEEPQVFIPLTKIFVPPFSVSESNRKEVQAVLKTKLLQIRKATSDPEQFLSEMFCPTVSPEDLKNSVILLDLDNLCHIFLGHSYKPNSNEDDILGYQCVFNNEVTAQFLQAVKAKEGTHYNIFNSRDTGRITLTYTGWEALMSCDITASLKLLIYAIQVYALQILIKNSNANTNPSP